MCPPAMMSSLPALASKWSQVVAQRPTPILLSVFLLNVTLTTIFVLHLLSTSFDEPLTGFEARGSSLSNRINTWKLISGKSRSRLEDELSLYHRPEESKRAEETFRKTHHDLTDIEEEEEKRRLAAGKHDSKFSREKIVSQIGKGSFCADLSENYLQLVLKSQQDIFSVENLEAVCRLDHHIRSSQEFRNFCGASDDDPRFCCLSWTLPNLVAAANNKTLMNCDELTSSDVSHVKSLLHKCLPDYNLKLLHANCYHEPRSCPTVPPECFGGRNLVYNLLHYILEIGFVDSPNIMTAKLKSTNIFLPVAKSSSLLPFFHSIQETMSEYTDARVNISSMDLGVKEALFDSLLLKDSKLVVLAFASIAVLLWLSTPSLVIATMTCLNLISSAGFAYILYRFVYGISFFPFMNLMTVIIIVAVGTDNTLVICKVWTLEMENKRPLGQVLRSTLEKSLISTFFTSLTTCLALLASFSSNITSIRCFSLYSSTAVMALYFLTALSLPPALILSSDKSRFNKVPWHCSNYFDRAVGTFVKIISSQLKYWVSIASIIISIGCLAFGLMNLRLPSSDYLQTFNANHPLEVYDTTDRELFKFSRHKSDSAEGVMASLPITVVFGVRPIDNGFHLDPNDRGTIELDPEFDISSPKVQEWLLYYCQRFKKASFYQPVHGPLLSNCFIETLKTWIEERDCLDHITNHSNFPCCKASSFPYPVHIFNSCLSKAIDLLHRTPTYILSRDAPGIRFSRSSSKVAAVIVQYHSTFNRSTSYQGMKATLTTIDNWFNEALKSAPSGVESGWFVSSHLDLYALQDSLLSGTYASVGIAVMLAFFAVSLVTWNVPLTLATLLSVCGVISSTLAIMVYCFEWELNIIESVVILVAIGMSVDLPLHYAICFKQNTQENLSNRTSTSLRHVGTPLLSAALTTGLAGLCMLPSNILAYKKTAHFLIIVSAMNVLFTFIFLTVS